MNQKVLGSLKSSFVALVAMSLIAGCLTPLTADQVKPAAKPEMPHVVVLKSGDNAFINGPANEFIANSTTQVSVFTLDKNTSARAAVAGIELVKPDLIFALGTRAAKTASTYFKDIPIIFSMVMNYERHGFQDQANMAGIAVEIDPAMELLQYKMVTPNLAKVIAFHGPGATPAFAERATEKLTMLGVQLELIPVSSLSDLEDKAPQELAKADAVWFINDPVVGKREAFECLKGAAHDQKKPLIASISDQFAELGALMTVSVDLKALGAQAASMAQTILLGQVPVRELGIRSPIAGQLTVNLDTAKRIELSIAPETMPNINRLIGQEP